MKRPVILMVCICLLMSCISLSAFGASAEDYWPAWRGPQATGGAVKGAPPTTWSETENIKWKVKVPGTSLSSPVIWENKIFFLTAQPKSSPSPTPLPQGRTGGGRGGRGGMGGGGASSAPQEFSLVCMDRRDGKILWQKIAKEETPHEGHHGTGSFASGSAVTDGKLVWAGFGSRGGHWYDVDGNHKWSRDLGKLNILMSFGEGSSIALAGDAIIAVMDHQGDSAIYALNKNTGKTLWTKARDEGTSWATPLPIEVDGKLQVVTSATNAIRSYDIATGDIVWQCKGQTSNVIPSPVTEDGVVFCISGFRSSACQAIQLGKTGDLTGTDAVLWEIKEATPYVPSPLLYQGRLYFNSVNTPTISCYEAKTGKPLFTKQRLSGISDLYASPVGAGGYVYFAGRNGTTSVLKAGDTFEVVATNKLDDGFDASPAVVGDELYLKGKAYFYCIARPQT